MSGSSLPLTVVVLAGLGLAVTLSAVPARARGVEADAIVVVGTHPRQSVASVAMGSGAARITRRYPVEGVRSLGWSPNRRLVAVVTAGTSVTNAVSLLDLPSGRFRPLADARRGSAAAFFGVVAWSPRSGVLAVTRARGTYGGRLELLDANNGRLLRSFRVFPRLDSRLSWSRDGNALFFVEQRRPQDPPRLRKLDVKSGRVATAVQRPGLDPASSGGPSRLRLQAGSTCARPAVSRSASAPRGRGIARRRGRRPAERCSSRGRSRRARANSRRRSAPGWWS